MLDLLVERKDVATMLRGKTISDSFVWRDEQARMFIVMERTERNKVSALLLDSNVLTHQFLDRQPGFDLSNGIHRKSSIAPDGEQNAKELERTYFDSRPSEGRVCAAISIPSASQRSSKNGEERS